MTLVTPSCFFSICFLTYCVNNVVSFIIQLVTSETCIVLINEIELTIFVHIPLTCEYRIFFCIFTVRQHRSCTTCILSNPHCCRHIVIILSYCSSIQHHCTLEVANNILTRLSISNKEQTFRRNSRTSQISKVTISKVNLSKNCTRIFIFTCFNISLTSSQFCMSRCQINQLQNSTFSISITSYQCSSVSPCSTCILFCICDLISTTF